MKWFFYRDASINLYCRPIILKILIQTTKKKPAITLITPAFTKNSIEESTLKSGTNRHCREGTCCCPATHCPRLNYSERCSAPKNEAHRPDPLFCACRQVLPGAL